ncbi:MAG TPA: phenylacetic acid degradation bifunctional protein PaaZ [Chitinophagaceae bacterium]|nr:phenylacetic acid degradation bifunctional protein PaaZ [Chitinophagaceae bacterium]
MEKLTNYVTGHWVAGAGEGQLLYDAVTGEPVAAASTQGLDFGAALAYGRRVGGPALRRMTFHERGRMLKALALYLQERKEFFYRISYQTGATRADSWIDIEGGFGNLFSNASLRRRFPDLPYCTDGEPVPLSKGGTFMGHHLLVPREGVAIHINAYNFPVWGMLEKCAVNWLAGMPALVKPATITSFLTHAVVREIVASGILPPGALQLVCGSAGDLLDQVESQDVVTFTGSASTGHRLKAHPAILRENVPFNMEADSLNCLVLGEDVSPGSAEWDLFVREVRREMTVKAGQKCTAIRRIFVPENKMEEAWKAIAGALDKTPIGNPANEKVRMGALAGLAQREEVRHQVRRLLAVTRILYGSLDSVEVLDADAARGAFLSPVLLLGERPFAAPEPHEIEAFGPVSTIMPYKGLEEAVALSKLGRGSLCSTIVTADPARAASYVIQAATHHGRILVLDAACAAESTGHGSPLPMLVHGGPGRAGGGEEMGGVRGVKHYMQRTAIQGSPAVLTAITGVYQAGAAGRRDGVHPFRKYFEELSIGDQLVTASRLITAEDIDRFADLSGDHFYAHGRDTDFTGTMFARQVAHGYFILSAAAGLFVDGSGKGPVLLNYGIDELRFTKPVYPGMSIHVRFTCREKLPQDSPAIAPLDDREIPRGIVRWLVEVLDDDQDTVATGTILTMVTRKNPAQL